MVERLRDGPGANVNDETRLQALRACAATYGAVQEATEVLKTLRAEHSNEIKRWKKNGVNTEALKKAIKDRFLDPSEVIAELHEYTRMRALQNMPTIQDDLMALWKPVELDYLTKAESQRQRWRDDGAFTGRNKGRRDTNPHAAGSEAFQQWDLGWLEDQERIAKAMGDGRQPETARARPGRKQPAAKTPAKKAGTPRKKALNGAAGAKHEPEVEQAMGSRRRRRSDPAAGLV